MANNTPHPPCTVTLDSPYFRTIIIDHSYVFIAHGARYTFFSRHLSSGSKSFAIRIRLIDLSLDFSPLLPSQCQPRFRSVRLSSSFERNQFARIEETRTAVMYISLTLMIIVIFPVYIGILYLRAKILTSLHEIGDVLSEKTKHMHSQFVKMLTLQCVIPPVVFAVTMLPIHLESMQLVMHPIMEAMINIVGVSSLTANILFRSARVALIRWIKGRDSQSPCTTTKSLLFFAENVELRIISD
ncbi:hypothetical protein PRIPAC_97618 [Pristionchus pacificus]|uniref:G protein-coupled receptor n=1 Tax=Pristionchus pacificus TaxID=54126 RepID=A0A2A6D2I6_PRIPA|nr:hypothetical protein PRIPAC_97618 [Pristionchus pacificus]|eukprot:PDM84608.1 G protein-coupled receptor [Pristionchus pacificus]